MAEIIRLRFDDRTDSDRWQNYIDSRPDSSYADLAEWRILFHELYGIENDSYLCRERGRITGALSLYHIRSPFLGKMLVTSPFFGCGGLYWESESARDALIERAREVGRQRKVDFLEFRLRRELPPPFRVNPGFSDFDLELDADPEQTWKQRLSSNVRQNVRKSRTHHLAFRLSAEHRPCYDLLRRTLRRHGTPFHDERFFRLLRARFADRVRFAEVWREDRLLAGGVVIRFQQTLSTPYIGSLFDYRALRANYFQYWGLIEHGAEVGIRRFEMGRSPRGSTHDRFKRKWGCHEVPLFYNYHVFNARKGYRSVSQPSRLQRVATRMWRHLPLAVTTLLGPRLCRYIP
jgi:FemAB-related protein (PEP-CTERM system-associated)